MSVRSLVLPLFAFVLVALPARAAAPPEPPLAIIAAVRGRADVTPGVRGAAVRAAFGTALARGDRISVGPGGHVTVFFNDGNVIELEEKSSMTIGGRASARARAASGAAGGEVFASVNRFVAGGSRETGIVGMTPLRAGGAQHALLLRPRRTSLLDARPAFTWSAVPGATRYRVVLGDARGELWRRDVSDTSLAWPADAPALAPGADVTWEVHAMGERGELRTEDSPLQLLGADDAARVRTAVSRLREAAGAGSPAAHYLSGSYFFGEGLYGEAAEEFEALRALDPAAAAAHAALGDAWRAMGLVERAAEEYRAALALSR